MLTRYHERREFIRVPASGPVRWRSGERQGHGQLVDISPGGAALRLSARRAAQLSPHVSLSVEVSRGVYGLLAGEAQVVRRGVNGDGECVVGLVF